MRGGRHLLAALAVAVELLPQASNLLSLLHNDTGQLLRRGMSMDTRAQNLVLRLGQLQLVQLLPLQLSALRPHLLLALDIALASLARLSRVGSLAVFLPRRDLNRRDRRVGVCVGCSWLGRCRDGAGLGAL